MFLSTSVRGVGGSHGRPHCGNGPEHLGQAGPGLAFFPLFIHPSIVIRKCCGAATFFYAAPEVQGPEADSGSAQKNGPGSEAALKIAAPAPQHCNI